MAKKQTNDLGKDPVGKLLVRLALPAITAQLINALYNIVDRIYIGHIEGEGDVALTGLGITFPIIMLISAFSALIGMGGSPRASIRMGEGHREGAEQILGNCFVSLIAISVCLTAVFLATQEPLLMMFGASERTLPYATDYLTIYLCGTIFVQMALGLNPFITIQGYATTSMLTVFIGAVINIALDPLFIFGFGMGVKGAALATILAQAVSAVWVVMFLMGKKTQLHLRPKYFRFDRTIMLPVLALGLSPFIMQSTESAVNIALNSSLQRYGGDLAVGGMTICSSVMQVIFMPLQGLTQGAQPIISFNYGANQLDRVRKTFKLLFATALTVTVLIWIFVQVFPEPFVALFNDKPELTSFTVWALRIYMAGIFMVGIQTSCQQTFVALGQAKVSLFLALLRKVILLIPLVFILPLFLADKVFAVYLAEPIADIIAATCTGTVFLFRFRKILHDREMEGVHD
ncbi:MAG TPA: MATE family efflux transporter [Candidatus Gallacutalibacter pullistercoris]|nr:MATE family efflux transporter [Candidatus Gallacutalibacter pullistercoris]